MSEVHANPDELEAFAQQLQAFAGGTRDQLQRVGSMLREMGSSSWTDQRYLEFEGYFEEVEAVILRAAETIEAEHIPHLTGLAAQLREYENR